MSRHEHVIRQKTGLSLSTKMKLLGGAAAATLVGLVSGCGSSGNTEKNVTVSAASKLKPADEGSKWDPGTEAVLQKVIERPMDITAKRIVAFARKHPGMAHTFVGVSSLAGNGVDLSVSGHMKYTSPKSIDSEEDNTSLDVITRQRPGSKGIDLGSVVGISISSTISVPDHPRQGYDKSIDLGAPGTKDTIFDNDHTDGWFAEQWGHGYIRPNAIYDSSVPGLYDGPHDPIVTAEKIVNTVSSLLNFAEADLGFIAKMRGH